MKKNKQIRFKISSKIMLSIIIVSLVGLITIAGSIAYILNKDVGKEARTLALSQVESVVSQFERQFSDIETATNVMAKTIEAKFDLERALVDEEYLDEFRDILISEITSIGEGMDLSSSIYAYLDYNMFGKEVDAWVYKSDDGTFELQAPFGSEFYSGYADWYHEPVQNGKTFWTFPYDATEYGLIGIYNSSFVMPIIIDETIIGMAGMDMSLENMQAKLLEEVVFESGYLYMMNSDGDIIVHPTIELGVNIHDLGDYTEFMENVNSHNQGFITNKRIDGTKVFTAFKKLENNWIVATSVPEKEVLAVLSKVLMYLAIISATILIMAIIVSLFVGKAITNPILQVLDATNKIKGGDLTTVVTVKSRDETYLLAEGLNEMTSSVGELISETKKASVDMVEAASNLASMAEETNATVDEVLITVENITEGTQETSSLAETGANIAKDIDEQFLSLINNSDEMRANTDKALIINTEGNDALKLLQDKSSESQISNGRVKVAINNLDEQANAITNIIATITSIAEQTNLLALNASIEAARAGEAGRGFAVVAEEIRKLAESSSEAANEISSIITSIQSESKDTVLIMNEVSDISEQQNEAVQDVSAALGKIFKSVEDITMKIGNVTTELTGLDNSKTTLIDMVTSISSASEESAASTEQVGHSMTEQSKAIEEVSKSAELLNELSTELNKKIEVFKV